MAKKAFVYDGSQWVDIAQSTTDLSNYANMTTTPISGFRNAIINGDFRVWQRGTSFSVSPAVTLFTADRFSVFNNATSTPVTVSQQAFTPGNQISGYEPANFLRCTMSGYSSSAVFIGQKIEDVRTFAGQTITVSYWAKASVNMSLPIDYVQWFGTGGSSLVNASLATASVTTSWQRFTHTLTVPSISGKTVGAGSSFEVRFLMSANGNLDIWGVQVEKGTVATPFEQRPIGTELALCQRYYYRVSSRSGGTAALLTTYQPVVSTTSAWAIITTPVTMRTMPTAIDFANIRLDDTQTNPAISGLSFRSGWSSDNNVAIVAASTGLTTLRSYAVIDGGSGNGYIGISAEL